MFTYTQPKEATDIKSNKDCMIRAVANATNYPYQMIHKLMYKYGWRATRRYSHNKWESQVTNTLDELGFKYERISYQPVKGEPRITSKDFFYKDGTYIIRTAKHLSCVRDGRLLDTWDCSDKCIYFYWKIL